MDLSFILRKYLYSSKVIVISLICTPRQFFFIITQIQQIINIKGEEMKFKELLKKHGFNLSSLAVKIGVNRATTFYWVKDKTIPRRDTLEKVAEVLGESVDTVVAAILE